jgi:hypothetical protein
MFTFNFRYERPFLRRYYVAEVWRTQGGVVMTVPIAVLLVVLSVRSVDFGWISGFFGGLTAAYVLRLFSAYKRLIREMANHPVQATVSDAGLAFDVESVTSLAPWAQIRSLRGTAYALIFTLRWRARPIVLPRAVVSPEASVFIARQVSNGGGTVTDTEG